MRKLLSGTELGEFGFLISKFVHQLQGLFKYGKMLRKPSIIQNMANSPE
jgi:hypothetical protein